MSILQFNVQFLLYSVTELLISLIIKVIRRDITIQNIIIRDTTILSQALSNILPH